MVVVMVIPAQPALAVVAELICLNNITMNVFEDKQ